MKEISLESEAGFKALFEYATIAILVISRDGLIELINPAAEKLFGYNNAELIGHPLEMLIPGDLRQRHVQHRTTYFDKPKARPMGRGIDLFAQKKEGHVFPVEISLGYYQLEGEMLAVAFVTDITERKQMEQQLKEANELLEKKVIERTFELTEALEREKELSEMKSRFVSMASHEFRTPLSAVLSSISLVETYKDPEHDEKRKKHIERIKASVRNLTDILNNFLSLDKLEQGKIEAERSQFDISEFMEDIIEEMDNMLKKKNQRVIYSHSGEKEIVLDRKILRNIMFNLLSNAIKYSPENTEIFVSIKVDDKNVVIAVKDNGMGIPEQEQKNLFKNFFRANNTVNIQGTGLGLSIVKKYVELLHGSINFESKTGSGTIFTVQFPENGK
ncbi:MAG TPA: PAS domain-containing sensor histidine kinase [Parafilimonas sp.]|nr:PAS domain-containing sensor histidine kinase [Parafilimonas sp.]